MKADKLGVSFDDVAAAGLQAEALGTFLDSREVEHVPLSPEDLALTTAELGAAGAPTTPPPS